MISKQQLCFLCFLLSFSRLLSSSRFNSTNLCPPHQALALLHLKQSFSIVNDDSSFWDCDYFGVPSYPKTESWKESRDCCSWDGVTCDFVTGHVIGIDLSCSWLSGTIHSNTTLFLLPHLRTLNLAFNNFYPSPVSAEFGHLSRLTYLNLSDSGFSGQIAPEIFHLSNLVILDLSWNTEARFAPHDFHSLVLNLTKLQVLNLAGINISSPFPNPLLNLSMIYLDLFDCGLRGRFPPSIGNLTQLYSLNLGYNQLEGVIPSWLFSLPSLEALALRDNKLTGHIGEFQYDSLEFLSLRNNELQGSIPSSIFKLVNLTLLFLSSNNLSGVVEIDMFGRLRNLKDLDLSNNILSLSISANSSFASHKLEHLGFSSCNITEFPGFLPNQKELQYLDLSNNNIGGNFPKWVWSLKWLEYLDLSTNKIDGKIPNWARNMGKDTLWHLNLSQNLLSGFDERLRWKNLKIFDLHSNLLQGSLLVPTPFTQFFSVANNNLTGEIPPQICKMSSTQVLDLSNNSLSGMLPRCLGNFSKYLSILDFRMNNFHGTILAPCSKGNFIRNLDFNHNQFDGPLPRYLINCRELEVLGIGNNRINDTFPHWSGTLPKLQVLILRSNNFHGEIGGSKIKSPFPALQIMDISHNDFTGNLPEMYLRNLKAMMNLNESGMERKYMGGAYYNDLNSVLSVIIGGACYCQDSIVMTVKGLEVEFAKILTIFTTIDFSSNKFQGKIPEFGNLNSLRGLNLSHNNLTGHIPLSLGKLRLIESLDLSSNNLSGRIPQELTTLTFLEVLNLSKNHLIGAIPEVYQFNTFENNSYNQNLGLCGAPLSNKCIDKESLQRPKKEDVEPKNGFDWKVVLMGYGYGLVFGLSMGCLIFVSGKPEWFVRLVEGHKNKKARKLKWGIQAAARR